MRDRRGKAGRLSESRHHYRHPFDLWIDIMTRKADGQQMFMEQQYTVAGDLMLMLQLFKQEG